MLKKFFYVWRAIIWFAAALFVAGAFMILTTLTTQMEIGQVIAWTITILSFSVIVASAVYGFVVQRVNEIAVVTVNLDQKVATRDELNSNENEVVRRIENLEAKVATGDELSSVAKQVQDATSAILNAYKLATKDLLQAAREFGLEMVYNTRSQVEAKLGERLMSAKREVKVLGICIGMPTRVPNFKQIVQDKAKDGVLFQFAFLQREIPHGEFDLYHQRARDENYPATKIGDLKEEATRNIETLMELRRSFSDEAKENLKIKEYRAFPYMSMIIIDDEMFVGPYLFGVNCPIIPMYKIAKTQDGIYHTYYKHFTKLWDAAVEVVGSPSVKRP